MKRLLLITGLAGTLVTAQAQVFNPDSVGGAFFGALAGGMIGGDHCHLSGEGAAIGAGVGFLLGSLAHESRRHEPYYGEYFVGGYGPAYSVSLGYGYPPCAGVSAGVSYSYGVAAPSPVYTPPPPVYLPPPPPTPAPPAPPRSAFSIPDAPTIPDAPSIPPAPQFPETRAPQNSMAAANALFGR